MGRRQLRPKQPQEQEPTENELTEEQVTAYIRQSSTRQVEQNIESADLQLSGAQKYAISQGLHADKIVIAHEGEGKRGVSGTLRIEQRDRLRDTLAGVKAGTIKVIWSYSVSRLFRDRYGVQVATFIELCAEHNVKVVIQNAKTFDFSNSFDIMLFQFLANVAARENEERTKLLAGAKAQKALRGQYHGKPLQPGYIVDRNKDSKTYGRYIPYEPHAKIMGRLYRRFRELDGRFNQLASEVAKLPVLFPPFEAWVSPRDANQLRLKKVCKLHGKLCDCKQEDCELAGYHVSRTGLLNLLTAVEYAGYWKFHGELLTDETGQPVKNHEAIVPHDEWMYAFNRLSFTTLTGESNPGRGNTRTWTTAKHGESATLLEGILTSPLGTVHVAGDAYKVLCPKEGSPHYDNVLTVQTAWIDTPVKMRLMERLYEDMKGHGTFLREQLKQIKASNAEALVSVDEQIKNYRQAIANREAYIAAVGAAIDKETALKLNADMIEDRKQLAALLAKRNDANEEVAGVEELLARIRKLTGKPGKSGLEGNEESRRFIKLACERVELSTISGHMLTLTVTWRAPFAQTDVCYIWRPEAGRQELSKRDEQILRDLYPDADRLELMKAFPTRSWQSIKTWAYELGIKRRHRLNTSDFTDESLSYNDWQLLREHGEQFHVMFEKPTVKVWWDNDKTDTRLRPAGGLQHRKRRRRSRSQTS